MLSAIDPKTPAVPAEDPRPVAEADECRALDKFYTMPEVAAWCMEKVREHVHVENATWVEPSAGSGVFLELLPQPRIGLDLAPAHPEVKRKDFTQWAGGAGIDTPVVTVGNPPFGKNASLALIFLNSAAAFSDYVCMILPRTFEKKAMQNKVVKTIHLLETYELDPVSFTHKGRPYAVPCCFQIWEKLPGDRRRDLHGALLKHTDFEFVEDWEKADFAFQRVGGNAGRASTEGLRKSWKSNHFIKVNPGCGVDADFVMRTLDGIDWSDVKNSTAGNPSIGKGEMIAKYSVIRPNGYAVIEPDRSGTFDFGP